MGTLASGTVVLIHFPYSNLERSKLRPALVIGQAELGNIIVCQITSQSSTSLSAIVLLDSDFIDSSLERKSYVRPDKIFTASPGIVMRPLGTITATKLASVKQAVAKALDL